MARVRLRLLCSRPLANYSDISRLMCLPHRMAGEWLDAEVGGGGGAAEGRLRSGAGTVGGSVMGLGALWQAERSVLGLETVLRLAHEVATAAMGPEGGARGEGGGGVAGMKRMHVVPAGQATSRKAWHARDNSN